MDTSYLSGNQRTFMEKLIENLQSFKISIIVTK